MPRSTSAIIAIATLGLSVVGCSAPKRETPLDSLVTAFRETYAATRDQTKQRLPTLIVVSGSSLILSRGGHPPERARVIPDIYHRLKAIAHLPFAVYLRLASHVDRKDGLPEDCRGWLQDVQSHIAQAKQTIAEYGFSAKQIERQLIVLSECSALLSIVLAEGTATKSQLTAFAQTVGPMMMANARDAGFAQVTETHRQMMTWKKKLTKEEWATFVVVSHAKHQARYRNAAGIYFGWLLNESAPRWSYPGEGMRVIYAEDLFKDERPEDLLATVLIDAQASAAFFGDPWRLSEDVLSDGADACIKTLAERDREFP